MSTSPAPLVGKTVLVPLECFSTESFLHLCQKSVRHICEGLFLVSLLLSTDSLNYCIYIISHEARESNFSHFVLFQIVLAILESMVFLYVE